MAYTLSNKCTKNCCKRTILVQLIAEEMWSRDFFGTHCTLVTLTSTSMNCRLALPISDSKWKQHPGQKHSAAVLPTTNKLIIITKHV